MRCMDIRKRIYKFPKMESKKPSLFVSPPHQVRVQKSQSHSQVAADDKTGAKYPLADYEITPNMAIVDANLVMNMPKSSSSVRWLRCSDSRSRSLRVGSSERITQMGKHCKRSKMLSKSTCQQSYANGANDPVAREKVHNAAAIAGVAFANAFLKVFVAQWHTRLELSSTCHTVWRTH